MEDGLLKCVLNLLQSAMRRNLRWLAPLGLQRATSCATVGRKSNNPTEHAMNTEIATLGGGCFWCLEAVYQELRGVQQVESGYSGGHVANPTYEKVCEGTTGHAEVVRLAQGVLSKLC